MTAPAGIRERAAAIAERCADAYSASRYRSWREVARVLLRMGFTDAETEAVMRSKITRWAADSWTWTGGDKTPAKAVAEYIRNDETRRGWRVRDEIRDWARVHAL